MSENTESTVIPNLSERVMLVRLQIRSWSCHRKDKAVTEEVRQAHSAPRNAGKYQKNLIDPKTPAYDKIRKIETRARAAHNAITKPWTTGAHNVILATSWESYTDMMRDVIGEHKRAVKDLCSGWPSIIEDQRERLNGMFCWDDYPDALELEDSFAITWERTGLIDPCDFRANLSEDELEQARGEMAIQQLDQFNDAVASVWKDLHGAVERMVTSLSAYDPSKKGAARNNFKASMVDNIRAICDTLPALNFADDPKLTEMGKEIAKTLAVIPTTELKASPFTRKHIETSARDMLTKIEQYAPQSGR